MYVIQTLKVYTKSLKNLSRHLFGSCYFGELAVFRSRGVGVLDLCCSVADTFGDGTAVLASAADGATVGFLEVKTVVTPSIL